VFTLSGVVGIAATHPGRRIPPLLSGYLQGPFGRATVQRFVADLSHAGIPVFEPGASTPIDQVAGRAAPVRLTLDQAGAAALGISRHAGISGARLDSLVHLTAGRLIIPMGAIMAGWAKRARTPAGAQARRILGRPDWRHYQGVVFPDAVLLLFAADVGSHLTGGAASVTPTTSQRPRRIRYAPPWIASSGTQSTRSSGQSVV
jgi:hypothetical protein